MQINAAIPHTWKVTMIPAFKLTSFRGVPLHQVGLVRAFTEALGQKPIIRALQLKDIPKLGCSPKAADRRKELQLG